MTYNPQWVDNSVLDPTKFGNWVLVEEYNLSSESLDETITWDGEQNPKIRIEWLGDDDVIGFRINGDTASNYDEGTLLQDGSGLTGGHGTFDYIRLGTSSGVDGFYICEGNLKNTGERRYFHINSSRFSSTNTDSTLFFKESNWSNTSDDVTSITFISNGTCTGNLKVYRWQDIVPVELHSLELVAEYNLSSESLDETITWDGEQNPKIRIECDGDDNLIQLRINGDTGSNYPEGSMLQDGSTGQFNNTTKDSIYIGTGDGVTQFSILEGNFKNTGTRRAFINYLSRYSSSNNDSFLFQRYSHWDNTVDDVTSITLFSSGVCANCNVKVYRRAKTSILSTAPDALHGLELSSVDASGSINVAPGSVEIKGKNIHLQSQKSVDVFTDLRSGDSVSGSQYVYAYAYDDNNTVNIEFSTTQPTKDRYGNTVTLDSNVNYSKGLYHANDPTRRYIGSVYVESGGSTIREFDVCYPGYCKGSWTPIPADADSGGNQDTSQTTFLNSYVKNGSLVYLKGNINNVNTSGMTGGNTLFIQGMPYTCLEQVFGPVAFSNINDPNNDAINASVETFIGTKSVRFRFSRDDGTLAVTNVSDVSSGVTDIKFTVHYVTDDF